MIVGAKVPNSGPLPEAIGIATMGRTLEAAGFESLWVSDHIVMPAAIECAKATPLTRIPPIVAPASGTRSSRAAMNARASAYFTPRMASVRP